MIGLASLDVCFFILLYSEAGWAQANRSALLSLYAVAVVFVVIAVEGIAFRPSALPLRNDFGGGVFF